MSGETDLHHYTPENNLTIEEDIINKGYEFLHKIEKITSIPQLQFDPRSQVFIMIPLHQESENVLRLLQSWNEQIIPPGTSTDIVLFINNTSNSSKDTQEDNARTANLIERFLADPNNVNPNIHFHILDKFSSTNMLPEETSLGAIRNIAIGGVIKRTIETRQNALVLATDADCFPSNNVIDSLYQLFRNKHSVHGAIERIFEFPQDLSLNEKAVIKKLHILGTTEAILLEYLTSHRWEFPDISVGANTFYSIDQFLSVGGYSNEKGAYEDTDLSERLQAEYPQNGVFLDNASIINIQRYSDRVEGDGALLSKVKENEFKTSIHAETLRAHLQLRRWFTQCLASSHLPLIINNPFIRFAQVTGYFQEIGITDASELFPKEFQEPFSDMYEGIYVKALKKLEEKQYDINDSLSSLGELIDRLLNDDPIYKKILSSHRENLDATLLKHYALHERVLQKSNIS